MSKKELSNWKLLRMIGAGGVLAAALSLLLSMLMAALMSSESVPESALPLLALPVAFISTLAGALLAVRAAGQKRLLTALGAGAVYLLVALLLRAVCFRGDWSTAPALAALAGSLTAGALSTGRKKHRRQR